MIFTPLSLAGAYRIDLDRRGDERGFFARMVCSAEFADHGLETTWPQCNISHSRARGTLRGLHFQRPPKADAKLVTCIAGAVHDVIVDLRRGSPDFGRWTSARLSAESGETIYVPPGFAHGFQTLTEDARLLYFHSQAYSPEHEGGLSFADPALGIDWPLSVSVLSGRDAGLPPLAELEPMP